MFDAVVKFVAPWAAYYGDHTWVATTVAFLHLAGLLWGGGRAVVADALTLRSSSVEAFLEAGHLRFMVASHRDVLIGLGITMASGLLLLASDLEHFVDSPLYWAKMGAVLVLLVNGAFIKRVEAGLSRPETASGAWGATRRHAIISLIFWFSATLLGQAVVNA